MKNKHRRQGRVKVSTLHGGRDRNYLVVARAQRATVFDKIKDNLLAEAEMLVLQKKGAFSIAQIAHMAVEQFLSRGGSEIAMGGNHKGFIIDDETKSWWAAQVERSIESYGVEKSVDAAQTRFDEKERELTKAETELSETNSKLNAALNKFREDFGFDHDDLVTVCLEVSKNVATPPITSANNVEVGVMGLAHLFVRLRKVGVPADWSYLDAYKAKPELGKMLGFFGNLLRYVGEPLPPNFLLAWARSAYARLEIGHKIAASFCLTDVPDGFVEAPWEAWSLVVPDGLLSDVARVWSVGLDPMLVLNREGRRRELTRVEGDMVKCLVRSSALALANPDEFKKQRDHGGSSRSSKGRHEGPPDLAQARYMISAPVEVDLRENVAAALEDERLGRKHASPKVQFLVRGHPRMQVHGEGRTLRKKIWIQPFWKGPAEGRILLRPHRVDES